MGKSLVIATSNSGKMQELRKILPESFNISGLSDLGFTGEIPETGSTLEENALAKARYTYKTFQLDCLADDTGLEVEALSGAPGVWSARFAGEPPNPAANNLKLLESLKGVELRKARFRTVLALIMNGKEWLFDGVITGTIAENPRGSGGFGYDPLFIPDGFNQTFAEMTPELKNTISHRAAAVSKLAGFLATMAEKA